MKRVLQVIALVLALGAIVQTANAALSHPQAQTVVSDHEGSAHEPGV